MHQGYGRYLYPEMTFAFGGSASRLRCRSTPRPLHLATQSRWENNDRNRPGWTPSSRRAEINFWHSPEINRPIPSVGKVFRRGGPRAPDALIDMGASWLPAASASFNSATDFVPSSRSNEGPLYRIDHRLIRVDKIIDESVRSTPSTMPISSTSRSSSEIDGASITAIRSNVPLTE